MSQSQASERRRMFRFPVSIRADIRYQGLDLTGFTADVSVSGAFIRPQNDADPVIGLLLPGERVELLLETGPGKPMIIEAQVVHTEDHGIGLLFGIEQPDIFSPMPASAG